MHKQVTNYSNCSITKTCEMKKINEHKLSDSN